MMLMKNLWKLQTRISKNQEWKKMFQCFKHDIMKEGLQHSDIDIAIIDLEILECITDCS